MFSIYSETNDRGVVEISFVMFLPLGIQDLALKQAFVGKHDISAVKGGFICGSYSRWHAAWSIVYPRECVCEWISWRNAEKKTIICQCASRKTSVTRLTFIWQSCDLSVFIMLVSVFHSHCLVLLPSTMWCWRYELE